MTLYVRYANTMQVTLIKFNDKCNINDKKRPLEGVLLLYFRYCIFF